MDPDELCRAEAALAERLESRGLDVRRVDLSGAHAPEAFAVASRGQRSLVVHAKGYPAQGENRCAAWVEGVFSWAGLGLEDGHACDLFERYCTLDDPADLRVDGEVMDCTSDGVRTVPLSLWLMGYGALDEPRWGWMRGIALA